MDIYNARFYVLIVLYFLCNKISKNKKNKLNIKYIILFILVVLVDFKNG